MPPGLVSTIIPVYNRPDRVVIAVQSVLDQTYRPIEIILVDDGSTDETPEVLAQLASEHPGEILVLRQNNGGAGLARETGRRAASGDFIQYLDSDDYLLPNKFTDQVKALTNHPECAIAYGSTIHCRDDGRELENPSRRTGESIEFLFPLLLVERWWHTHTPLFRRWISDAAGAWPAFRPEDWDLEARMGALNPRLIHCGTTVSVQVDHDSPDRVTRGNEHRFLLDEAIFLPRLHACALLAGVESDSAEMQHFAHWCFLRARQLHAFAEAEAGDRLLRLATMLMRPHGWKPSTYNAMRHLIGASASGRLTSLYRPKR
jgi:glycosyltransferase involved in cell wall biosynthesis